MVLRSLFLSFSLTTIASASFCGDSSIPYSLEILSDGQPVLGCARPTCFGWGPNGQPATVSGSFFRINNNADGFIRGGRDSIPAYGPNDDRFYRPQTAVCDHAFGAQNCPSLNQWVGGIAPLLNVSGYATVLQCCTFDVLRQSEDRGVASIHGGQIVIGGEVMSSGLQVGFDYISDLVKVVRRDGTIQYDVSIRRMPCPDLTLPKGKIQKADAAQAFQAPNVVVAEPLPLPGAENTQNAAILEEIQQEEAFQLPANTQFQAVQPQPQFVPQLQAPPQFAAQPVAFQAPQFVPPPAQAAPVAQAYYPQTSFFGAGGNGQWCFTGDMTVKLMDGSEKRMDELQKNDWVLAVGDKDLSYVPVEFWLHRVPAQEAEFNKFETEDGRTIKLTDKHYIYKGTCTHLGAGPVPFRSIHSEAVTADQVKAGDCLYTLDEQDHMMREVLIVRSSRVTETGIYAPMTSTGRILVNGIHTSCHNIMQAHSMGHTVFGYVDFFNRMYESLFGSEDTNEIVETPAGLSTMLAMAEIVIPKNLITM